MEEKKIIKHRVITTLDRNEIDFLDKLGKDALFSTGHKLSYNDVLKGLIDLAKEAEVSADNVESPESFKENVLQGILKFSKKALKERENDEKPST